MRRRRLRLAQDQWLLAERGMIDYRRAVSPYVQALAAKRESFDDIKLQAGPAPHRLLPLAREIDRHARFLALIAPPPALVSVHAAFRSAYALAKNAVNSGMMRCKPRAWTSRSALRPPPPAR